MAGDVQRREARDSLTDPLQPLIVGARLLASVVLALLLVATVAAVFGTGSVATIGDDPICVGVDVGHDLPMVSGTVVGSRSWGLAHGVSPVEDRYQLCQDRPGGVTQY